MKKLIFALFILLFSVLNATTYYVSTSGNDSNGGETRSDAYLTIGKAATVVVAGDEVIVLEGTYTLADTLEFTTDGNSTNKIRWYAENNNVIISQTANTPAIRTEISGDYNEFSGFRWETNNTDASAYRSITIMANTIGLKFYQCNITNYGANSSTTCIAINSGASVTFYSTFIVCRRDGYTFDINATATVLLQNCTLYSNYAFVDATKLDLTTVKDCVIEANTMAYYTTTQDGTFYHNVLYPTAWSGDAGAGGDEFAEWNTDGNNVNSSPAFTYSVPPTTSPATYTFSTNSPAYKSSAYFPGFDKGSHQLTSFTIGE